MKDILKQLNIKNDNSGTSTGSKWINGKGDKISSFSPVDGKFIASVSSTAPKDYHEVVKKAKDAFVVWKNIPAPISF